MSNERRNVSTNMRGTHLHIALSLFVTAGLQAVLGMVLILAFGEDPFIRAATNVIVALLVSGAALESAIGWWVGRPDSASEQPFPDGDAS